ECQALKKKNSASKFALNSRNVGQQQPQQRRQQPPGEIRQLSGEGLVVASVDLLAPEPVRPRATDECRPVPDDQRAAVRGSKLPRRGAGHHDAGAAQLVLRAGWGAEIPARHGRHDPRVSQAQLGVRLRRLAVQGHAVSLLRRGVRLRLAAHPPGQVQEGCGGGHERHGQRHGARLPHPQLVQPQPPAQAAGEEPAREGVPLLPLRRALARAQSARGRVPLHHVRHHAHVWLLLVLNCCARLHRRSQPLILFQFFSTGSFSLPAARFADQTKFQQPVPLSLMFEPAEFIASVSLETRYFLSTM
ncbi:hypothetical protein BOX15_Mlig010488g1, partial [Macrostomum lignano]